MFELTLKSDSAIISPVVSIYKETPDDRKAGIRDTEFANWHKSIQRLPSLTTKELTSDLINISVCHEGQIVPFNQFPGNIVGLGYQFNLELTGMPRSAKTAAMEYINYQLRSNNIPRGIAREPRPDFNVDNDPYDYNLWMGLNSGTDLLRLKHQDICGVTIFDRGPHNFIPYRAASKTLEANRFSKKFFYPNFPRWIDLGLIADIGVYIDSLFIFHCTPETSLSRGSTMSQKFLGELARRYLELPKIINRLRVDSQAPKDHFDPLFIAEFDANSDLGLIHDLTIKTMGTIISKYAPILKES